MVVSFVLISEFPFVNVLYFYNCTLIYTTVMNPMIFYVYALCLITAQIVLTVTCISLRATKGSLKKMMMMVIIICTYVNDVCDVIMANISVVYDFMGNVILVLLMRLQ